MWAENRGVDSYALKRQLSASAMRSTVGESPWAERDEDAMNSSVESARGTYGIEEQCSSRWGPSSTISANR